MVSLGCITACLKKIKTPTDTEAELCWVGFHHLHSRLQQPWAGDWAPILGVKGSNKGSRAAGPLGSSLAPRQVWRQ